MRPTRRATSERGSALLIVFVFAAIVAITLYMELPVAAFEAQRQKEQLLVDAGNEYAHSVKLFVRKVGRYPNSIKDLEDTNRMRFLRRELPDPFTGKADWRLLHAGPGGIIIDSKVNPLNPLGNAGRNGNGNAANTGSSPGASTTGFQNSGNSSAGFGTSSSSANSGFGASSSSTNSGFGSAFGGSSASTATNTPSSGTNFGADSSTPEVVVQQPRQRGPAIAANGSQTATPGADTANDTASPPLPPDTQPGVNPTNTPPTSAITPGGTAPNVAPGSPGGTQATNPNGAPDLKASMLGTAAPSAGQTSSFGSTNGSASSQMGTLNSGGLAGVASKASGHSIKTVNDQSNYSLWEFYYDPKKDALPGGAQMGAFSQQNGGAPGQQTGAKGQNSSAFGASSFGQGSGLGQGSGSGQSSSFGQGSSSGQSSFGNNTNSSFGQSNSLGNTNQNSTTNNQQNPQ